ncbi:DUF4358 domain-containing protein [Ruminococcus sp. HUN007]|jgi:hypothetical protein|uniref:DUF4358 domain-containing protein n=1 Tax=Ruminococcus sp. HUN007 TaxID=1514668 RepID=UPI0005D203CF|nr:DUF4358 domain-containing protein [Ruminococcus sp. HUN007]
MKKLISAFTACVTAGILLCSCSGGSSEAATEDLLKAALDNGTGFDEMVSVEGSDIKYTYDIEESWYDDFAASVAGNMAYAEEAVFVKASSDENVEKIEKALEKRLQSRKETLKSYAPAEFAKLENSSVETKGRYVYLVVCEDSKKALKAAEKAF